MRIVSLTLRSGRLRRAIDALEGPGRTLLYERIAIGIQELTIRHFAQLAGSRHATAERLGASPTNYFAQAAEKTAITADEAGATLILSQPGLIRALRDVTIQAKNAGALTIAVDRLAYGRRAGEFAGQLFLWRSRTTGAAFLAMRHPQNGASLQLMYLLLRSVTQRQDRTLLPSDQAYREAALTAAIDLIHSL